MGVLDTAKPFHRIEIFDPDTTKPKYVISPNVFLDTEKPGNNDQVGEIYLTNLNIVSSLDSGINICELELKHEPSTAPAIEMDSLVKVYLGYYNEDYTQGPEYSLVFTGYLTRQMVHLRQTSLECKSRLNKIITLRKKMTFSRQMTIDEIIQKLAIDEGGIELASNGITTSNINKLPGFGFSEQQPVLDHVKLLAGYNGFNVYMDINDKFHASGWAPDDLRDGPGTQNVDWLDDRGKNESENSNIYKHTFTFGSDLMECEFELSAGKCSAVEITGFIAQSDDLTHTIDPPKVEFTPETGADSNLPKQIFKLPHVTREDAEKIAENLYWRLNRQLTGKIKVLGSPQVRLGDGIKIAGEVYDVEPFGNFNFDTDNSGDQATLESKTLQVVKVNHRFNHTDGFISRLDLAEGRVAVGVGAEEEEAEEDEEEEEEEETEEEEEEEEEEAEEGEEGEETEEEEEEEEEGTMTAHVLEIEDALFHHDSAVILPEQPTGPSSEDGMGPSDETEQITGISVISSIYNYLDENPDKQLIIAGHTDTSGRVKYNFELSALRSWSVFYLLMGDKVRWAENSNRKNKVEDYQQILKHYARLWGWDCDPGEINDELNAPTREAIRKFQVKYNAEFGQNISVDGIMGPQTWGAFFDCYIRELATMQNTTPEGLAEKRDKIKYVSDTYKILACGESHPIEEAKRDNYRSQINRRVEVLFFDSDKVPELNCPSPTGPYNDVVCDMETCPIYKEGAYEFEHISPETAISEGISLMGELTDHFAPSEDEVEITYKIKDPNGRFTAGRIEINGANYPNNPVAIIPLEGDYLTPDTEHTITWKGERTCTEGPLAGVKYVNPIYSPYSIVGVVSSTDDFSTGVARSGQDRSVKVLIYSLELQLGTYTVDGDPPDKDADRDRWVQFKLNELGYNSGPLDGIMNLQTQRAIKRYTRALENMDETDTINDDIITALDGNRGSKIVLEDKTLPNAGEEKKIWLDYNYFYETFPGEFSDPHGHVDKAEEKLDRMEFPIEVKILLLRKDSVTEGVFVPLGVGPIRVNWSIIDPAEDISNLEDGTNADVPSRTQPFVDLALQLESGRTGPGDSIDNCHDNYAGFRRGDNEAHRQYFREGTLLPPYTCNYDDTNIVAFTEAHADPGNHENKLGMTGVFLRSSYIGGDDYRIKAQVSFEGLSNAEDLQRAHGAADPANLPSKETGTLRIWRRCKIATVINWPARARAIDWDEIGDMYEEGYNELDIDDLETKNINEVITEAEFQTVCNATNGPPPAGDNYTLKNNGVYGLTLPNQTTLGMNAAQYRQRLEQICDQFVNNITNVQLQQLIDDNLRDSCPEGWIVMMVNMCEPVNVLADPANGNNTVVNANWVPTVVALGLEFGIAMIDNTFDDSDGFLIAHEMAHCRQLLHHETNGSGNSDVPDDHDLNDHNCIMCYPHGILSRPGLTWNDGDATQPRFCGKCNLKVRGWDIRRPGMPPQS